ncbi:MAG: 2-oxoacid:ferredoxin oxidoreductase subunit beta [Oligoflexia bacterium]|nr:2-oxoacid:ferredoxin oxidoreductase subunit beta [Oligoflexia bacterium]MBF0364962.1 2-oxoacid:ferredoxin oxidoreductase subunit beta [Oligoflexia bacterium]
MSEQQNYTRKDFASDQEVKWCPGCGDYSILASIQSVCAKLGHKKEDVCFISGIGCSSRLPYYMNTYGMHTIHGRAIAVASGLKIHNPKLSVWVATGDGDAMSIGGNHFIHAIRRNIGLKIVIFNNEIYGLTKGQYSPTSRQGLVTKSSPYGTIERPFSAAALAIGSGATFFARTIDSDPKHMQDILLRAHQHRGMAIVEVLQNCVIFNDGAHSIFTDKTLRDETTMRIEHGKAMIFGTKQNKGIRLTAGSDPNPEVVTLGEDGISSKDLLVHDERKQSTFLANLLTTFNQPTHPLPLGVFRAIERETYEECLEAQTQLIASHRKERSMQDLLLSGETWMID